MKAKEFIPASKPRNFVAKNQKTAGAGAHRDKKKEQKQGYEKHKSKVDEGVSYGSMPADAVRKLLSVYNDQSQGVELYRDSEGAERLGKALDDAAKKLDVAQYMRSLYNSASHSAHMDYDTNPGDFKNWFNYVGKHLEGLDKLHREKGSYDDEPDTYVDKESRKQDAAEGADDTAYGRHQRYFPKGDVYNSKGKKIGVWNNGLILDPAIEKNWEDENGYEWVDEIKRLASDYIAQGRWTVKPAQGVAERVRDPEDWDEGNTEPGNNFAIYINGKKWKVFPGPYGAYADSPEEEKEFYRLKDMARRKSQATGKKWEVYKTGEPATK